MMCANMQLTDYDAEGRPARDDLALHSAPLSEVLTQELDGAAAASGLTAEEVLLAALGRTIDRTIGDGIVTVDLAGVDAQPVVLTCTSPAVLPAVEMLAGVHHAVAALRLHRAVHGLPVDAAAVGDVLFTVEGAGLGPVAAGHALEVHARRCGGVLVLDWWYDARAFEPYTVEELSEQFPLALVELTSEACAPIVARAELAMA